MKRILFFTNPFHLSVQLRQIQIRNKNAGIDRTIPAEDVGFIVLEHPQITLTQGFVQLCMELGIAVVFCNDRHLPSGLLTPFDGNSLQTARFRSQTEASEPLKKQLWKQIIQQKITNQACVLKHSYKDGDALLFKYKKVKSGDSSNEEAKAASIYWKRLLGEDFLRDRFGDTPNAYLNYGYAILRAATARALTGSGLHPTLGLFHRNQYNSFCLADDLMEPYRPFIDLLVMDWISKTEEEELTKDAKAHLIGVLNMDTMMGKRKRPLSLALSESSNSLVECLAGEQKKLRLPSLVS